MVLQGFISFSFTDHMQVAVKLIHWIIKLKIAPSFNVYFITTNVYEGLNKKSGWAVLLSLIQEIFCIPIKNLFLVWVYSEKIEISEIQEQIMSEHKKKQVYTIQSPSSLNFFLFCLAHSIYRLLPVISISTSSRPWNLKRCRSHNSSNPYFSGR